MKNCKRLLLIGSCLMILFMEGCAVEKQSKITVEDMKSMSADELFDLFIRNGLVINERMANTLSEEVIKETLKSQIDILIEGITPCNDIIYWDFADSVKETYEKISGERE